MRPGRQKGKETKILMMASRSSWAWRGREQQQQQQQRQKQQLQQQQLQQQQQHHGEEQVEEEKEERRRIGGKVLFFAIAVVSNAHLAETIPHDKMSLFRTYIIDE